MKDVTQTTTLKQGNETMNEKYQAYRNHMLLTMPDCEPMSFEHWVIATQKDAIVSAAHAKRMQEMDN